jgi:hypothetical protein
MLKIIQGQAPPVEQRNQTVPIEGNYFAVDKTNIRQIMVDKYPKWDQATMDTFSGTLKKYGL